MRSLQPIKLVQRVGPSRDRSLEKRHRRRYAERSIVAFPASGSIGTSCLKSFCENHMRLKLILSLVAVSTAMAWMGPASTHAQDPAPPLPAMPRPLPLEYSSAPVAPPAGPSAGATAPGIASGAVQQTTPTQRAVTGLANPFDGGTRPGATGLRAPVKSADAPAPTASGQGFDHRLKYGRREVAGRESL